MTKLRLSVVITNFNYARFLPRALESVLQQSRPADQIIAVDDGSTDGSPQILERFKSQARILFQPNRGQAAAINAGVRVATGDFVCFLDSDDSWAAERLYECEKYLLLHPSVGYLHHPARWVDESDRPILKNADGPFATGKVDIATAFAQHIAFAPTSCMVVKRSVLNEIGKIPEDIFRLRADFFLQTVCPQLTEMGFVGQLLTSYRIHGLNGYSGAITDAKLQSDFTLITQFASWLASTLNVRVQPASNFYYARSAVWVRKKQHRTVLALKVIWEYLASVGTKDMWTRRYVQRLLLIAAIAVSPPFGAYLFNRAIRAAWRRTA